jgi:hypothetical protein
MVVLFYALSSLLLMIKNDSYLASTPVKCLFGLRSLRKVVNLFQKPVEGQPSFAEA